MSTAKISRRTRVERNIYRRPDGKLEVGYRDSAGVQRWRVPDFPPAFDTITQAKVARNTVLSARGRGERVQPNPRLTFGQAADRWLAEQVADLRPTTQASYRNSIETHLRPRWGKRRLDSIRPNDAARLVRELRSDGKAEATIGTILMAATRTFAFASRRCEWHGENPVALLEKGERPKSGQAVHRIFQGEELAQTLAAAHEPYRTLFGLAAVTGARESELLGLTWADVDLAATDAATVTFLFQLDRQGRRVPLKTDESRRTVELPRQLAAALLAHKARSPYSTDGAFIFATRSRRAISQRNLLRELRRTMARALDDKGRPMFPALQQGGPVARGAVPSFHGFRHTAASQAIHDGDSAEQVSWQLGHKSSVVTRAVYVHEIKSAERIAQRRGRMEARYGAMLSAPEQQPAKPGVVVPMETRWKRGAAAQGSSDSADLA